MLLVYPGAGRRRQLLRARRASRVQGYPLAQRHLLRMRGHTFRAGSAGAGHQRAEELTTTRHDRSSVARADAGGGRGVVPGPSTASDQRAHSVADQAAKPQLTTINEPGRHRKLVSIIDDSHASGFNSR